MLERSGIKEKVEKVDMAARADSPRRVQVDSLINMIMRYYCYLEAQHSFGRWLEHGLLFDRLLRIPMKFDCSILTSVIRAVL